MFSQKRSIISTEMRDTIAVDDVRKFAGNEEEPVKMLAWYSFIYSKS